MKLLNSEQIQKLANKLDKQAHTFYSPERDEFPEEDEEIFDCLLNAAQYLEVAAGIIADQEAVESMLQEFEGEGEEDALQKVADSSNDYGDYNVEYTPSGRPVDSEGVLTD